MPWYTRPVDPISPDFMTSALTQEMPTISSKQFHKFTLLHMSYLQVLYVFDAHYVNMTGSFLWSHYTTIYVHMFDFNYHYSSEADFQIRCSFSKKMYLL